MDQTNASLDTLDSIIRRWTVWFRLRRALSWSIYALLLSLAFTIGFSLAALGQSIIVIFDFILASLAFTLATVSLAALSGYSWGISSQIITRFFDHYFALFDRASTAFELSQTGSSYVGSNLLAQRQVEDTIKTAGVVKPDTKFFITISNFQIRLALGLVCILVIVGYVSKPAFRLAQERQVIRQIISQETQRLEELKKQVDQNETLTAQQKLELTRELDQAIRKLENAKNLDQAIAALEESETALQKFDNATLQQQASDLRQAGQQLLNRAEGSPNTPLNDFAKELAANNLAQAAQQLQGTNLEGMDSAERENLADQLEQVAQTVDASNQELADQIQSAVQSLRQGDIPAAQQALDKAAQTLTDVSRQTAQAQSAQYIAEQINQGRVRMLQAGQSPAQGSQPGDSASQATGQNSSQGLAQGSGNASDSNSQNSSLGSGSGRGSSPGSEVRGSEVDDTPIDQNNAPGDGGERRYEEVFAPNRLSGTSGVDVTLPPSKIMNEVLGLSGANPGNPTPSKVPFQEISPNLIDAYRNYSSHGEVPTSLRQIIKTYYYNITQP